MNRMTFAHRGAVVLLLAALSGCALAQQALVLTTGAEQPGSTQDGRGVLNLPARAHHPDVILLDIEMPRMDGYEVAAHVRNDARLADVPSPIAIVDVFRNSEAAGETVDEALALPAPPRAIWLQLGVTNAPAAARAQARGVMMVMDRCIKVEIRRLGAQPPA